MNKRIPIILGILLTLLATWVLMTPNRFVRNVLERLENLGYDLQLITYIATKKPVPSPNVAIIDIDDKSLNVEGRWPWPRGKIAELVNQLHKQGAAVIAFDTLFTETQTNLIDSMLSKLSRENKITDAISTELKSHASLFDDDAIFAKSLEKVQAVLAIGFLPRDQKQNSLSPPLLTLTPEESSQLNITSAPGYISNIPILQNAAKYSGFINIFPDNDGIIRHSPLLLRYHDGVYPSLALQAVILFLGGDVKLVAPAYGSTHILEGIQVGSNIIPTDANGETLIPFIGKSYSFSYYSATDVLRDNLPKDALLGKIIFIGTSATGLGDLKATAIQNPFPGVEIQATLASGILENEFSYRPAWTFGANLSLTLLFGLLAAFTFPYFGPRTLGVIVTLLPVSLLFLNNWIWIRTGLILSFLVPVILVLVSAIVNVMYGYLFETRRRERLKEMFGQYVPEKHIDEMLKATGGDYGLGGEDRDMSVLFADIRNFTTISEGMSAAELVEMLNTFFTPMTEIIFNHRGTIDKYVGDLIMAFWSAPLKDKNHARHAIETALEMQKKVKELRSLLTQRHWPEIHIGIGVNSGMMSVGDMGSSYRRNYTVLGDAVNLASRVEGLTKFYGVDIIVTEITQQNQAKYLFRKLDRVRVKGKKTGIEIYEVLGHQSEISSDIKSELAEYHRALEAYFHQRWEESLAIMQTLRQSHPNKKIYSLYIERIQAYQNHSPPADWDGVYEHTAK